MENLRRTEMDELKSELKTDARRHSNKLVRKLEDVMELPDIGKDSIHQEMQYAVLDGYRMTMRAVGEGES